MCQVLVIQLAYRMFPLVTPFASITVGDREAKARAKLLKSWISIEIIVLQKCCMKKKQSENGPSWRCLYGSIYVRGISLKFLVLLFSKKFLLKFFEFWVLYSCAQYIRFPGFRFPFLDGPKSNTQIQDSKTFVEFCQIRRS